MESLEPWIEALVKRDLSSYLAGTSPALNDDGCNFRFLHSLEHSAFVNSVAENNGLCHVNLSDWVAQVNAIIQQESLKEYRNLPRQRPLDKNARGYFMHIRDFELVVNYESPKNPIHIDVKRFSIAWEKDQIRTPPKGKSVTKLVPIKQLVRDVIEAKCRRKSGPREEATSHTQDALSSQAHASQGHEIGDTIMSQMPCAQTPRAPAADSKIEPNHETSSQLLRNLAPSEFAKHYPPNHNRQITQPTSESEGQSGPHKVDASLSKGATGNAEHRTPEPIQRANHEDKIMNVGKEAVPYRNSERGQSAQNTPKTKQSGIVEHRGISPRTDSLQQSTTHTLQSSERAKAIQDDPWHGMTRIHKRDIRIPKDQWHLLEEKRLWVPARPGETMPHGHLPPNLLDRWNTIALRKNRMVNQPNTERDSSKSESPNSPEIPSAEPKLTQTDSDSESDSEKSVSEWGSSPASHYQTRPARELPADSSPLRPKPAGSVAKKDKNMQQRSPNLDQEEKIEKAAPASNHRNVRTQGREDSGDESDEMETSVPLAFGASSQQTGTASQSEPAINSSNSSYGQANIHVQVMETPANNFTRRPTTAGAHSNSRQMEQPSSDIKSSQSRIFNTYHSSSDRTKGTQESHDHSAVNDEPNIDIHGTQLSDGHWETQETRSSNSQSGIVLDSSQRKNPDSNMGVVNAASQSDESSKPFSSYREVLPSTQSDEEDQGGEEIHSSLPDILKENAEKSPMKRPASVMDTGEAAAPKRHKPHRTADTSDRVLNTTTRKQSFVSGYTDHVEAKQVYDKFRANYPTYSGEFGQFTELCSKLQSLWEHGTLKRSFLWDDFIIQHVEGYPRYLERHITNESKGLPYDEYFTETFSRPSFKKRLLSRRDIEISAAQYVVGSQPSQQKTTITSSIAPQDEREHAHQPNPQQTTKVSSPAPQAERQNARQPTPQQIIIAPSPAPQDERENARQSSLQKTTLGSPPAPQHEHAHQPSPQQTIMTSSPAPQHERENARQPSPQETIVASSPAPRDEHKHPQPSKASFTGSLVDKFSKFHTHSFTSNTPEPQPRDRDITQFSSAMSTPHAQRTREQSQNSQEAEEQILTEMTQVSVLDQDMYDVEPRRHDDTESIPETEVGSRARAGDDESQSKDGEENDEQEYFYDAMDMDETHETASIELGEEEKEEKEAQERDQGPPTSPTQTSSSSDLDLFEDEDNDEQDKADNTVQESQQPPALRPAPLLETSSSSSDSESDDSSAAEEPKPAPGSQSQPQPRSPPKERAEEPEEQAESELERVSESEYESDEKPEEAKDPNENWFTSINHMFPSKPVWSDDPNTPFKVWARAISQLKPDNAWVRRREKEKGTKG